MVYTDKEKMRTPFIKGQKGWVLSLLPEKVLEWGHRFDAEIGYRVYVKFQDSMMSNCFTAVEAKKLAKMMQERERGTEAYDIQVLSLAGKIADMAAQVQRLNDIWLSQGGGEKTVDEVLQTAGNA